eukprot:2040583-Rhodomonas_salina.3
MKFWDFYSCGSTSFVRLSHPGLAVLLEVTRESILKASRLMVSSYTGTCREFLLETHVHVSTKSAAPEPALVKGVLRSALGTAAFV